MLYVYLDTYIPSSYDQLNVRGKTKNTISLKQSIRDDGDVIVRVKCGGDGWGLLVENSSATDIFEQPSILLFHYNNMQTHTIHGIE